VALKQAVGTDLIREREQRFLHRALARWRGSPNLELLGDLEVPRLPIVSFPVGEEALAAHCGSEDDPGRAPEAVPGLTPAAGATPAEFPPELERLRDFHLPAASPAG